MKPADVKRTVYPLLPDIMDPDSLSLITHLEEPEKEFILQARTPRLQYLRAIYLKAMSYFRHSRYAPGDLPRLMRLKMAEQLDLPKKLANILKIHPVEKSRLVGDVRGFLNIKRYTRQDRQKVEAWLEQDLARQENNILVLINAIINWFKDAAIDIPRFEIVTTMAQNALNAANTRLQKLIANAFDEPQRDKIKKLVKRTGGYTPLSRFKADPRKASTVNLQAELERLKQLQDYIFDIPAMRTISREKVAYFADIGRRYTAAEIDQFNPQQCTAVLHCYLLVRRCELLDAAVETFIQVWREIQATAKQYADEYRDAQMQMQSEHDSIYRDLLDFICDLSDRDLVISIRGYRSPDEYKSLRKNASRKLSWSECYYQKIKDHYTTLRRFLPNWYSTVPMVSTAAADSILKAVAFIGEHGDSKEDRLPAPNISFDFLSPAWASRSLIRHSWDGRVKMLHKTPFELGMVDTVAKALKDGRIAVEGANRYGPMMEHLIARDDFLADYSRHLSKVGRSENASECYRPCMDGLEHQLDDYDRDYEDTKEVFRVNANGTLSYLRSSPQSKPRRIKKSASILQTYMTPATILEILLDCHTLTGFLDLFSPLTGRRHMSEKDIILKLLAAFYAYGCNCGPTQASRAIGVAKQSIVYFRRHFMSTKTLMEAATLLADAYSRTPMSQYLRRPGIFMTDAMHFPTLRDSLTARHYFRDFSKKNVLLYQHVTSDCVCFFTKALLCGVSEAIHMLDGAVRQMSGYTPRINICDNAGKSDLIFALAYLLNIEIWPRLNSKQNLKLWGVSKNSTYTHIQPAIAGIIDPKAIDDGWIDMMWIIASIVEGVAPPSLIAQHLIKSPKHPATKGFNELGKILRSSYMLQFGTDMSLRHLVMRYIARRENWNMFSRDIFNIGFGGLLREKSPESQEEIFWCLTVVQNAIALWNALAMEQAVAKARKDGLKITEEDLKHIFPTMTEHINFVGQFFLDFNRKPPFKMAVSY